MKTSLNFLTLCFTVALLLGCGPTKRSVAPSVQSRALDEMVGAKQFAFEAEWARPLATTALNSVMQSGILAPGNSATQINIMGSGYFFKMEGDSVSANLPYFGERQMGGGYNSDSGITFEGVPRDLKIEKDETKLRHSITFSISKQAETYRCRLDLSRNQTGTLFINSSQRSTIRYDGNVSDLETTEVQ